MEPVVRTMGEAEWLLTVLKSTDAGSIRDLLIARLEEGIDAFWKAVPTATADGLQMKLLKATEVKVGMYIDGGGSAGWWPIRDVRTNRSISKWSTIVCVDWNEGDRRQGRQYPMDSHVLVGVKGGA